MPNQYVATRIIAAELSRQVERLLPAGDAGRTALIVAEPEGGQRTLLQSLEQRARAAGIRVAATWVAPGRPRLLSVAALADLLGAPDLDAAEPATMGRRLRRALRDAGDAGPVLAIVHGLEELPPEDAAILEDLLAAPPEGRVALVATIATRRADGSPVEGMPGLLARLSQGRCHVAHIAPASAEEVGVLLEADLGTGVATTRFVRALTQVTRGRLDLLHDCLQAIGGMEARQRAELLAGSRAPETIPPPPSVEARAAATLLGLPSETRGDATTVATALAVWGLPATLEVLGALTGLAGTELEAALAPMERAGLVREADALLPPGPADIAVAVRDPLVAQALARQAPPLTRRRVHRVAVEVLEARNAGAQMLTEEETLALGRHLLASRLPMDGDRAAVVGSAARILVSHGRFAEAREQLQALDRLLRPADQAAAPGATGAAGEGASALPGNLAALLAETLSRSGEWEAAQAVLNAPQPRPEPDSAVRADIRRARDRVALGQDREAWTIYQRVLGDENPDGDPAITMARVEAARVLQTIGEMDQAYYQAEQGYREAMAAGDPRVAARARLSLHSLLLTDGRPHEALRSNREAYALARSVGDRSTAARLTSAIGSTLVDTDSIDRGVPWLRRSIRLAEACDDFPTATWTATRLANALGETGDLAGAERLALRAMHVDSSLHRLRALPRSHALIRTIDALRGRAPEGRPEVLQFWHGRELLDQGFALNAEAIALITECLAADDPRGAYEAASTVVRWFQACGGRGRFLRCELIPWQVESALRMRDLRAAEQAAETLQSLAESGEQFTLATAEVAGAGGRVARARGDTETAIELLGTAADALATAGYQLRRARVLRLLADTMIAAGQGEEAVPHLDEAHHVLATAGLAELKDVRTLYARINRRPPRLLSSSSLSEREMEVAGLAVRGLTDAEIAAALGIQRRTVTTHMHNILRKRGLRSRLELRDPGPLTV